MFIKQLARGPKRSRRLGKYVEIVNCPESVCTYSCIYCHGGHTQHLTYERSEFFNPLETVKAVRLVIAKSGEPKENFNFLAFIPDGEPTQDIHLGKEIELLRTFEIKIGVLTNSSLIWREDVRTDLAKADLVSLKLDALDEELWKKTNRPHKDSRFISILDGMIEFSKTFKGFLATETMLIDGHNMTDEHAKRLGSFLKKLKPSKAYLSLPVNPPTESWVKPPDEKSLNRFYQLVNENYSQLEYLMGYETEDISTLNTVRQNVLVKTSRNPIPTSEMNEFLEKNESDWSLVRKLVEEKELIETFYGGEKYYLRRIKKSPG